MQLNNIRVVLVEPSHPGNIGAVARAMKTMGLYDLVLVNPRKFPHVEAVARSAGAEDVLQKAVVAEDLKSVLADCSLVLGTSVRARQVSWPISNPKQAAKKIMTHLAQEGENKVAILFGRENSGLSNDELDLCQRQISIASNEEYSSLNLAAAVQIISYELRMHFLQLDDSQKDAVQKEPRTTLEKRQQSATKEQLDGHFEHLEETLRMLSFIRTGPSTMLMRKLTRLYNKAELTIEEIQILRGILTAVQDHLPEQAKD